jgi:hypothetical protein
MTTLYDLLGALPGDDTGDLRKAFREFDLSRPIRYGWRGALAQKLAGGTGTTLPVASDRFRPDRRSLT